MEAYATELNAILADGGKVQVTTYTRSWIYLKSWAGAFYSKNGHLYIRKGKRSEQLSIGDSLLVGIRTSNNRRCNR